MSGGLTAVSGAQNCFFHAGAADAATQKARFFNPPEKKMGFNKGPITGGGLGGFDTGP